MASKIHKKRLSNDKKIAAQISRKIGDSLPEEGQRLADPGAVMSTWRADALSLHLTESISFPRIHVLFRDGQGGELMELYSKTGCVGEIRQMSFCISVALCWKKPLAVALLANRRDANHLDGFDSSSGSAPTVTYIDPYEVSYRVGERCSKSVSIETAESLIGKNAIAYPFIFLMRGGFDKDVADWNKMTGKSDGSARLEVH